jgi:lipopolysaccharide export system protein LptA
MLRSTRALLLLAIVLILGAVGASYFRRKSVLSRQAPPPPKALPLDTNATATGWVYEKYDGKRLIARVRAKGFRDIAQPPRVELQDVELEIYKPNGRQFDRVRSASATLDKDHDTLYSDGAVEMTLGIPVDVPIRGRLLTIRSSGVSFDVKSGRAATDREASFTFELGEGRAVGATYDPNTSELVMKSQAALHWRGAGPNTKPMDLEAGELIYRERESVVLLPQWARLVRQGTQLDATDSVITLQDGMIRKVEGTQARGESRYPGRQLEYSADHLVMDFGDKGEVQKISGDGHARLISTSDTARTTIDAGRVYLDFDLASGESMLSRVLTMDHCALDSAPRPRKGVLTPETKLLHSEVIQLDMRPGGRDIEKVATGAPGQLQFLPNRPGQRHRTLTAERMSLDYGPGNELEKFSAYKAATVTDPEPRPARDKRPPAPPLRTWSDELRAAFDPKTGQLSRLEQWNNFRYEEGDRRGVAHRAVLEEARDLITLDQAARVWDPTGSTAADRILLDQKSGDTSAEGNVVSTRLPEKRGQSSSLLSQDEPLNAKAERMRATDHNRKITYEGHVVAWQGANRIWADRLVIDRQERRLAAHGNVRTQFLDRQKTAAGDSKKQAPPGVVYIESADLVYTEAGRLAHYTGGAHLTRPGLDVKAAEIRAYFNDSSAESSLNRADADGQVVILRTEPGRTVTATSAHAEYFASEEKIVLTQGDPTILDSLHGSTKGQQLTYWINNGKLLGEGVEKEPVQTLVKRRQSRE